MLHSGREREQRGKARAAQRGAASLSKVGCDSRAGDGGAGVGQPAHAPRLSCISVCSVCCTAQKCGKMGGGGGEAVIFKDFSSTLKCVSHTP